MKESNEILNLEKALAALEESSRTFLDLDDPRAILSAITAQVRQVAELEECSVILFDDEHTGRVVASSDRPDMPDAEIKISNYPELRRVIETKQPLLINDVIASPLLNEVKDVFNKKNIRSIAVLPVFAGNEMLGALFLRLARAGDPISNIPLSYFQATANTAALALRNIRLKKDVAGFAQETRHAKKEAREEQESRKWYQELFNLASDGLIIVDKKGRLVDANRKFELLTGYSTEEMKTMGYLDFVHIDDHQKMAAFFMAYRKAPASRRDQFKLISKNGEIKHVLIGVDMLAGVEGQALASFQDISAQINLQNQLQRTNEFFENIISSSVDAIIAADMTGKMIIFNDGAEKISGYKTDEVVGKMNIRDFYTPGAAKDAMKRLRSDDYGGFGKLESTHYNIIGKNGEEIPISLTAAIIYENEKEIASMGIFHDMRPRIRIEQELRVAQTKLIDSEKQAALAALSGATSHELNQPLTSIMGYAELLQKRLKVDDEIVKKAIQTIIRETERMGETIKKISRISRFRTRDYVGSARIIDIEGASLPQGRYENLFLSMRDGLLEFRCDAKGIPAECVFANPAAVKILGRTGVNDLLERSPAELFNDPDIAQRILKETKKAEDGDHFITRITKPDGQKTVIEITANLAETDEAPPAIEILFRDVTDRINVQKKLEEAERRARTLLEMAGKLGLGIMMMSAEKINRGEIVFANERLEQILGLTFKDLQTFPFVNLMPAQDRPKFDALFSLSASTDEDVLALQTELVRRDGSKAVVELRSVMVRYMGGRVIIGFMRDITEFVRTGEELRNLKELNESVIENAPIGIISIDAEGTVLSVNNKEIEIMGLPSKDFVVGVNLFDLNSIAGTDIENFIRKGQNGERVSVARVPYTSIVGKSMILRADGVPLKDEKGNVKGGIILIDDVTEEAELEDSLRRERLYHESVIEESPYPIAGLTLEGIIVLFNKASEKKSGYTREEVIGKNIFDLTPVEYIKRENIKDMISEIESKGSIKDVRAIMTTKSGEKLEMLWNFTPVRNEKGDLSGAITIGRDVTAERKLESETARRRTLLDVMRQIIRASLEGHDFKRLCVTLQKEIEKVIPHHVFSMTMINGDLANYIILSNTLKITKPLQGFFPLENTITEEIIRSGKPRIVGDFLDIENQKPDEVRVVKAGVRSAINVPVKRHNRLIGTLNIGSLTPNAYTEDDLEIFSQIADEFAIAFENHSLVNQLRETNENLARKTMYLETLLNTARSFRINMAEAETARQYAENIEHIFPSPHIIIYFKSPDKDILTPAYAQQFSAQKIKRGIPLKGNIKKYFEMRDDYLYVENIGKSKKYKPIMDDAEASLVVPIRIGDNRLGLLFAESHHENPFETDDIDLIVLLTRIMAASISNIRLFDQTCFLEQTQDDIIENAGALIATINAEGMITRFNKAFEQFTGYSKRELMGRPAWGIMKEPERRELAKNIWKFIKNDSSNFQNQVLSLKKKDGKEIKAVFNSTAVRDSKGAVAQYILIGYDLTDRKTLERQLEQSVKLATLGQMAASIAHDLNNPLTSITSYAQILLRNMQKNKIEPNQINYVQQVLNGANRIDNLLGQLMDYSRIDSGVKKTLDINHIIEETLSFSELDITKGSVKLVRKLGKKLHPALGFANQIQQVLINILTNASYILQKKGGGVIEIKTSSVKDKIFIEIADDGPGMSKEQMGRIFDPFYTTKPQGEGTGLGLSIVKNIIEKHNGDIKVKSKLGKGSLFTIVLPAYSTREPKTSKKR